MPRLVHDPHAATTDLGHNLVVPDLDSDHNQAQGLGCHRLIATSCRRKFLIPCEIDRVIRFPCAMASVTGLVVFRLFCVFSVNYCEAFRHAPFLNLVGNPAKMAKKAFI